jgi:hypothetical protein
MCTALRAALLAIICALCALGTHAQNLGYVSLNNSQALIFNAVSAPTASLPIQNLGQSYHILCYEATSGVTLQIRLEFSYTGTSNDYNPLSDDGSSQTQGCIYGQGTYPFVRANLVALTGSGTVTAWYTGGFAGTMPPTGSLNQSQQFKKVLALGATGTGSQQVYQINPPCANTSGTLWFTYTAGAAAGGSYAIVPGVDAIANLSTVGFSGTIPNSSAVAAIQIGSQNATYIRINIIAPLASTYNLQYLFNCAQPGGGASGTSVIGPIQPIGQQTNVQAVSNTNASVTAGATGVAGQRGMLFSLNARCSAGTAGITIVDGGTTIWSSGTTEVGTTSFSKFWPTGLASSPGNGLSVTLSACGAGNTGTLDVQASTE